MPIATDWSAAGRLGYNTGTAGDASGLTSVTFGAGLPGKAWASIIPWSPKATWA
ncbi:MAG: hypothetical protein IPN90_07100 [Elusimicrobia bacterium]|nr:hypothetical protein [Elusimicrobiota bacterium]